MPTSGSQAGGTAVALQSAGARAELRTGVPALG